MTSPDPSRELSEALWEAEEEFGPTLAVADQVAVARALGRKAAVTPADVKAAFSELSLPSPSAAYAKAVANRARVLTPKRTLLNVLLDYRRFAIRELSSEFGGKTAGQEERLKTSLVTYLPERGYTEARTGRGRTDIRVPPPTDAIIETKVWTGQSKYRDGVEELGRYIYTEQPKSAYMVVFGERQPLPSIVANYDHARAADEELEGLSVPIVVVLFEVDPPSKAAARQRRRERGTR
jgi:hypothetical protein